MRLDLNFLEPFSEAHTPQFVWVKEQSFDGKKIPIDNHLYEKCRFVDCNFLYSGGPFGFDECDVQGGYLSLSGLARNVAELLAFFREQAQRDLSKGPF
jgi:hypothetical protein